MYFKSNPVDFFVCYITIEKIYIIHTFSLFLSFGWDDEQRYRSEMQYFFRYASHDYIFQPFPAVRANNNNIGMHTFCSLYY